MQTQAINQTDPFTPEQLLAFLEQPAQPWVSIFQPIERIDPARQQNAIRLENLLRQAEAQLVERGMPLPEAKHVLAPSVQLIRNFAFWEHQSEGLAIFINTEGYHTFRLPHVFAEQVVVDTAAYITPLIPLLNSAGTFYILTLSLGGVHLYAGSPYGLAPVALPDVPASLEAFLAADEFSKEKQLHPGIPGRSGERGAIFHGQDARDGTVVKQETLRYFQQVDRGVGNALANATAPLILVGINYLLPIYRSVNSYRYLFETAVRANPTDLRPQELHARAHAVIAPYFGHAGDQAVERYYTMQGSKPALATDYLRVIIPAAHSGRVDTLLLANGAQCWGTFEPNSETLTLHNVAQPYDNELINLTAIHTLRHGGQIYALAPEQVPGAALCAAILRY